MLALIPPSQWVFPFKASSPRGHLSPPDCPSSPTLSPEVIHNITSIIHSKFSPVKNPEYNNYNGSPVVNTCDLIPYMHAPLPVEPAHNLYSPLPRPGPSYLYKASLAPNVLQTSQLIHDLKSQGLPPETYCPNIQSSLLEPGFKTPQIPQVNPLRRPSFGSTPETGVFSTNLLPEQDSQPFINPNPTRWSPTWLPKPTNQVGLGAEVDPKHELNPQSLDLIPESPPPPVTPHLNPSLTPTILHHTPETSLLSANMDPELIKAKVTPCKALHFLQDFMGMLLILLYTDTFCNGLPWEKYSCSQDNHMTEVTSSSQP